MQRREAGSWLRFRSFHKERPVGEEATSEGEANQKSMWLWNPAEKVLQKERSAQLYQMRRYHNKEVFDGFQKSFNEIGKKESQIGMGFRVEWCR